MLEMHRDVLCALPQATTVLNRQPLVCPQQLHLSAMEDLALRCGSSISVHPASPWAVCKYAATPAMACVPQGLHKLFLNELSGAPLATLPAARLVPCAERPHARFASWCDSLLVPGA